MATKHYPNAGSGVPNSELPLPLSADQCQSIDQLAESPEFLQMMKDEFPEDAPEWLDPVGRRKFLTLMGASLSLAGVVGCNPSFKPASAKKAIPYVKKPDALISGVPMFFATAFPHAGYGLGVLVKSQEGRPLKVEGNPTHPASLGATDMFAQGISFSRQCTRRRSG